MNTGTISSRYARAFLEYAVELSEDGTAYREMAVLQQRLRDIPEINRRIMDPTVSNADKQRLLEIAITDGKGRVSGATASFLKLVTEAGRAGMLLFMATSYMEQYRSRNCIVPVKLTTATAAGDERRERLSKLVGKVTDCSQEWSHEVDPSIEGGFILQVGDYRLDASVASQLRKIRKELIEKNNRVI